MAYDIELSSGLHSQLADLPPRALGAIAVHLQRLAEAAEGWPPGDLRWGQLARPHDGGLVFYARDCCVRVVVDAPRRRVRVEALGRVQLGAALAGPTPTLHPASAAERDAALREPERT